MIFFLVICVNISHSYSEELKFEATSIEIIDKDKIIIANEHNRTSKNLIITFSDLSFYLFPNV